MRPSLQLLDSNQTTVLWDFQGQPGVNPSGVRCSVLANTSFGSVPVDLSIFEGEPPGGRALKRRDALVDMLLSIRARATNYTNLAAGLGQLAAWLHSPPGPLRFQPVGGPVRFIDLVGSPEAPTLIQGGLSGLALSHADTIDGLHLPLLRQPHLKGETVVLLNAETVAHNVTSNGRTVQVTNAGNAPMPVRLSYTVNAPHGQAIVALYRGDIADYLSDTHYFRCVTSARGWTIALGADTASTSNSAYSAGTAARCTYATSPTVMATRVTATRSTKMASLRGTFELWLRGRSTTTGGVWEHQLVHSQVKEYPVIRYSTVGLGEAPMAFMKMGRVSLRGDEDALRFELFSRRASGSGSFDFDFIELIPVNEHYSRPGPSGFGTDSIITTFPEEGRIRHTSPGFVVNPDVGVRGVVPLWLPPGNSLVVIAAQQHSANFEHPIDLPIDRTLTLTAAGEPRYRL